MLLNDMISAIVYDIPNLIEIGKKVKVLGHGITHNWDKTSIFWDLPYQKTNELRHNIDVMHTKKNCFENVLTVVDVKGNQMIMRNQEKIWKTFVIAGIYICLQEIMEMSTCRVLTTP